MATIDATGISAPDYPTILAALQDAYRAIYGADVYLEPDSQDGQFLALVAAVVNDSNSQAVAIYNAFSPATAFGEGLSRVVKINGLQRESASYSTAQLTIGGTTGTVLQDALAQDIAGNTWVIPGQVIIPAAGTVTATGQCATLGAITAAAGTINAIASPTRGWQTVTNAAAATPGAPVETDAQLRQRQSASTALPSRTILEGITGALLDLPGVTRVRVVENATASTDTNGIAAYTVAFVVEGGLDQDVGNTIAAKKTPGVPTAGTTSITVTNVYGLSTPIKFYRPSLLTHWVQVNLTAGAAYTSAVGTAVVAAIVAYATSLPVGSQLQPARLYGIVDAVDPAGTAIAAATVLVSLTNSSYSATAPAVAFNQVVTMTTGNVVLNLV